MKDGKHKGLPKGHKNASSTPKVISDKEAYVEALRLRGRELSEIWRQMMEDSTNRLRDNERVARAHDYFFIASHCVEQRNFDEAVGYMEDAIKSLTSLIQQGVTKVQHQ